MRARVALALVVALVSPLMLTGAAAIPAPVASVQAADTPDFTPSGGLGIKKYMLNVTGKMLGKAMPKKWQAEQIANEYQYNHSWEQWEAEIGIPADVPDGQLITDGYFTTPQTKSDYYLRKSQMNLAGGKDGKSLAPPATKTAKLTKSLAGTATAITGMDFGIGIGNSIMDFFGVDVNGAVCANTAGVGQGLASTLTGADCDAWAIDEALQPNLGIEAGFSSTKQCTVNGDSCLTVTGVGLWHNTTSGYWGAAGTDTPLVCFTYTGLGRYPYALKLQSGKIQVGNGTSAGQWAGFATNGCTADANEANQAVVGYSGGSYDMIVGFQMSQTSPVNPVTAKDTNPDRTFTCSVVGSDGVTYTTTSAAFKETDAAVAPPKCDPLPEGVAPQSVNVTEDGGGQSNEVYNQDVNPEYLDWWNNYPECRGGACKLDLMKLGTSSIPVSCFDLGEGCADWFEQTNKADLYQCQYGIHTVDLSECYVYSGLFKSERQAVGAPYSDPLTGEWSGGKSAPSLDSQAMGQLVQDPATRRGCDGMNVTGFDPVGFVMRPIQCAMEWTFIPRPTVVQAAQVEATDKWKTTPFGQVSDLVAPFSNIPMWTGCDGIPIDIDFHWPLEWGIHWTFGASCTGALATTATVVKSVLGGLIVLSAVLLLSDYLGIGVGFRGLGRRNG